MRTTQRRSEPGVIHRLLAEPYRFGFFQAVRLLELWFKRSGVLGTQGVRRYIQFRNPTSLGFPASELQSIAVEHRSEENGDASQLHPADIRQLALTTNFMGFLGSAGTLPSHYSERIATHQLEQRDDGPRAFLDVFSSRSVALFYEAWSKYRLEFKYELGGNDQFKPLLLSLTGLGHGALRGRLSETDAEDVGVSDESLAYFAGALRQRPMSASYLRQILQDYFRVPIRLEQFVGAWYAVPPDQQTALGTNAVLGSIAIVGERVWQRNLRVKLQIGPLDRADYEAFLPEARCAKALEKLLAMVSGTTLEYEIELILRAQAVQATRLGEEKQNARLGWSMFMGDAANGEDRCDVRYRLHAIG